MKGSDQKHRGRVQDRRISRTIELARGRTVHMIRLHGVADMDERVRNRLIEAYVKA